MDVATIELSPAASLHQVLERVEREVARLYADVPETIRLRESELAAEERRLMNFVDFVGEGRGSGALGKALVETERRVETLSLEVEALRQGREKAFQAPPIEWLEERGGLQEVLERRNEKSARLLRRLPGPITLEPKKVDIGRPHYVAKTSIDALVLLEKPPPEDSSDSGSNSLKWWTRTQRIRTVAEVAVEVALLATEEPPLYQRVAKKALLLKELGLSLAAIARHLEVDDKTVAKAIQRLKSFSP